ncbi:MAG: LysR substrate-binding domain-containing protein, partial [Desulfovibrionales bacterium]|nr:LysR substrate-binding domain-containing protein [Desulfovibrionales bacterium]
LQHLFQERVVVIAQKDHPRIHGKIDLDTFLSLPHAMISLHNDTAPVDSVDQRLRELGLKRRIKFMTQRTSTLAEVVARTRLIGTMVERYAVKYARCHDLQIIQLPFEMAAFEMTLYWHKRVHLDPAHAWLRKQVVETCQNLGKMN